MVHQRGLACRHKLTGLLICQARILHLTGLRSRSQALDRLTSFESFVGREVREQMFDKVASLLHDLDEGMRPLSVIAPHFPTAYHRKRDK